MWMCGRMQMSHWVMSTRRYLNIASKSGDRLKKTATQVKQIAGYDLYGILYVFRYIQQKHNRPNSCG